LSWVFNNVILKQLEETATAKIKSIELKEFTENSMKKHEEIGNKLRELFND
jgi:hypothetical protein